MTLQQMRYLLAIADCGSVSAAAQAFYISQSSLSEALRKVENEYGIRVFNRSNQGTTPTPEGLELISMIRRVVQQDDLISERFGVGSKQIGIDRIAISSQRYSFVVQALAELTERRTGSGFGFVLRETDTEEILSDVRSFSSDLGIVSITSHNESVVRRELDRERLLYTPLVTACPCVVISASHPLAEKQKVSLLHLSGFPRIAFEQRNGASEYYSEDPLLEAPRLGLIEVRDRGSMVALLNSTRAYAIGSGFSAPGMDQGTVAIPLQTDENMEIGYVLNPRISQSDIAREFISYLAKYSKEAKSSRD